MRVCDHGFVLRIFNVSEKSFVFLLCFWVPKIHFSKMVKTTHVTAGVVFLGTF